MCPSSKQPLHGPRPLFVIPTHFPHTLHHRMQQPDPATDALNVTNFNRAINGQPVLSPPAPAHSPAPAPLPAASSAPAVPGGVGSSAAEQLAASLIAKMTSSQSAPAGQLQGQRQYQQPGGSSADAQRYSGTGSLFVPVTQ